MTIKNELNDFLETTLRNLPNKARDIQVINYYYGFGNSIWPTLEETGKYFSILDRERVRQIINDKFRKVVNIEKLVTLKAFCEVINSKDYWTETELQNTILKRGFVLNNEFSIKGLFNLLEEAGYKNLFEIYTPDLKQLTRGFVGKYKNNFILRKSDIEHTSKIFNLAISITS